MTSKQRRINVDGVVVRLYACWVVAYKYQNPMSWCIFVIVVLSIEMMRLFIGAKLDSVRMQLDRKTDFVNSQTRKHWVS